MSSSRSEGTIGQPWQLQVFDVSLKKRQKLAMLLSLLGPLEGQHCLLVTNGDNPGSLNHHLRRAGGQWRWYELEAKGIPEMERLLADEGRVGTPDAVPFPAASFTGSRSSTCMSTSNETRRWTASLPAC